jgi:hypothetical protein
VQPPEVDLLQSGDDRPPDVRRSVRTAGPIVAALLVGLLLGAAAIAAKQSGDEQTARERALLVTFGVSRGTGPIVTTNGTVRLPVTLRNDGPLPVTLVRIGSSEPAIRLTQRVPRGELVIAEQSLTRLIVTLRVQCRLGPPLTPGLQAVLRTAAGKERVLDFDIQNLPSSWIGFADEQCGPRSLTDGFYVDYVGPPSRKGAETYLPVVLRQTATRHEESIIEIADVRLAVPGLASAVTSGLPAGIPPAGSHPVTLRFAITDCARALQSGEYGLQVRGRWGDGPQQTGTFGADMKLTRDIAVAVADICNGT